jgi:transposase
MAKTRPNYSLAYRKNIIDLYRSGRSAESLAKEFEPSLQTIHNWIRQDDRNSGSRTDGLTSKEREEFTRMRQEVKTLRMEREILSKAAAWFARETDAIPSKRSAL